MTVRSANGFQSLWVPEQQSRLSLTPVLHVCSTNQSCLCLTLCGQFTSPCAIRFGTFPLVIAKFVSHYSSELSLNQWLPNSTNAWWIMHLVYECVCVCEPSKIIKSPAVFSIQQVFRKGWQAKREIEREREEMKVIMHEEFRWLTLISPINVGARRKKNTSGSFTHWHSHTYIHTICSSDKFSKAGT